MGERVTSEEVERIDEGTLQENAYMWELKKEGRKRAGEGGKVQTIGKDNTQLARRKKGNQWQKGTVGKQFS